MTDQTTAQLEQDLAAVDALISASVPSMPIPQVVACVDAWRRIYRQVLDEHAALERIQAEQKAKGAQEHG
jgi:hypothetical protein